MIKPQRRTVILLLVYVALSLLIMRDLVTAPGTIGLRNDWSIPTFSIQYQARMEQALVNWSPDYLGTALVRRTDLLLTTVLWIFATVFKFGGPVFSKMIPLLAFTGAGFFAYRLLLYIDRRSLGAFAGSLLYMLSPLMFNLMVFGQHHFLIGYSLYPLLVLLFLHAVAASRPLPWILASGAVFAFTMSQDTFMVIGGITLLAIVVGSTLTQERGRRIRYLFRRLAMLGGVVAIAMLLHAPTFFSAIAHTRATQQAFQLFSVAWNTWLAPETIDALTLEGAGIRSFMDAVTIVYKPWWMLTNTVIILLVFSSVLLPRKRRLMVSLAALGLGTIFIFKGVHPPLGFVNQWIFTHVPGMLAFRNLQYVTVFSNLIFAILLAHVINYWRSVWTLKTYWWVAYSGLLLVLLLKAGPFFSGNFNAGVQVFQLAREHEEVYTRLFQDPEDYRVLWLPPVQPMTYKATTHAGLDPFGSQTPKPSILDNPVQQINWLLNMVVYTRPETNLGEMLNKLAVRYVIYRDDLVSRTPLFQWGEFPKDEWTNDQLKRWLAGQPDLVLDTTYGEKTIEVFRHKTPRPRLAAVGSLAVSTGDLSDYVWLSGYWPTDAQGARDVFFASQANSRQLPTLENAVDRTTIVNNNLFDLTTLWLDNGATELYIPEIFRDTKEGWAQNWPWKDWRYASILEPAVYTVKAYEAPIPFVSQEIENASLWVKAYHSTKATALRFTLDGRPLKTIITAEDVLQGLQWHQLPVGTLSAGEHTLVVTSGEGENVIARMVVTSGTAAAAAEEKVKEFLADRELYLSFNFDFRDTPTYSSVRAKEAGTETLFTNVDLPLDVPVAGTYEIALHASGGSYISQEQREGDSYQTIEQGKTVGQTFTVALSDSRIERIQVSAEARELTPNKPASVMPDAPLRARLFQLKGKEKILVGESVISPSAAGINDAWKLVDAQFNVAIDHQSNPSPEYFIEFSTDATRVVWAVRTVQQGFRGTADYYDKGAMLVKEDAQPGDMAFTVIVRSEDAKLDVVAVDGVPLPSEDFTVPWQNRTRLTLTPGTHTINLRGVRAHTADVQLMMRRVSTLTPPSNPSLTIDRQSITRFATKKISTPDPYVVAFAETFDPLWQAVVTTDEGKSYVVPEQAHVMINGYANSWLINEPAPHTLLIHYTPQQAYQWGLYVSGTAAVAIGSLLGWESWQWLRRRRSNTLG